MRATAAEESPPPPTSRSRRPSRDRGWWLWVWVALAFVVLSAAWAGLIYIARQNEPPTVEVRPS